MATASQGKKTTNGNEATLADLGPKLWDTANTLRGNIDAAEYKHVVLPLMFLQYISDAFEELHQELESKADEGYDPEETDEYAERNVFWISTEAAGPTSSPRPARRTSEQPSIFSTELKSRQMMLILH